MASWDREKGAGGEGGNQRRATTTRRAIGREPHAGPVSTPDAICGQVPHDGKCFPSGLLIGWCTYAMPPHRCRHPCFSGHGLAVTMEAIPPPRFGRARHMQREGKGNGLLLSSFSVLSRDTVFSPDEHFSSWCSCQVSQPAASVAKLEIGDSQLGSDQTRPDQTSGRCRTVHLGTPALTTYASIPTEPHPRDVRV